MAKYSLDLGFHALADPTRRAMVDRLAGGPQSLGALGAPFAMALPTILEHVRVLERAGLVVTAKEGRVRWCRLRPEGLQPASDWFDGRRALWERRLDALERHLSEGDPS